MSASCNLFGAVAALPRETGSGSHPDSRVSVRVNCLRPTPDAAEPRSRMNRATVQLAIVWP